MNQAGPRRRCALTTFGTARRCFLGRRFAPTTPNKTTPRPDSTSLLTSSAEVRLPAAGGDRADAMAVAGTDGVFRAVVHAQVVAVHLHRKALLLRELRHDRRRPVHHSADRAEQVAQTVLRDVAPLAARMEMRLPQHFVR